MVEDEDDFLGELIGTSVGIQFGEIGHQIPEEQG